MEMLYCREDVWKGYIVGMSYANGREGWVFPREMFPSESNDIGTRIDRKLELLYVDDDDRSRRDLGKKISFARGIRFPDFRNYSFLFEQGFAHLSFEELAMGASVMTNN